MPKEMLPLVNKPLIQYGVEEALEAGLNQISVVSGRGKRAIEDHFDTSYELEHQILGTAKEALLDQIRTIIDHCTFSYTRQIEMLGLGHAILTGENLIGDEPFAVLLADDYCANGDDGVLKQMVKLHEEYQCTIVAIEEVAAEQTESYGIVAGEEIKPGLYRVTEMVEKPKPEDAPSNLAIIGRYILTPDIFDVLRKTEPGRAGEVQITDAIATLARQEMVLAYKFQGRRFDCGTIEGFVGATNFVYEHYYTRGHNYPDQGS
jgi:UTP--glucose-1-phosphate uridylyltransferase